MIVKIATLSLFLLAGVAAAQTNTAPVAGSNALSVSKSNPTASPLTPTEEHALALRGEEIRSKCVANRRYICGRILQIFPDGVVVDSGYSRLLQPPLNRSWLVPGTAVVERDPHLVESKEPDAICVGLVFLTDLPKSRRNPKPKRYDYVVAHGYPAGERTYTSVGAVQHTVRRYSMGLEYAVSLVLRDESNHASAPEPAGGSVPAAK